jgi:hypothetical protein
MIVHCAGTAVENASAEESTSRSGAARAGVVETQGSAMASSFTCDPSVARQVSGDLNGIRIQMQEMGNTFNEYDGASGSTRVEQALDSFFADSSDARGKLDKVLERASKLLEGLAEGVEAIDRSLVAALTEDPSPAGAYADEAATFVTQSLAR